MGLKKHKPYTPSRRHMVLSDFADVTKSTPERSLVKGKKSNAGRNSAGRISVRHRGGGHKRRYRVIDFKREKFGIPAKVAAIEDVDTALKGFLALEPDVIVVTGDHSTPALMGEHSWHSVPVILSSPVARHSGMDRFDEITCARQGTLGTFPARHLMGLVLGHAGRLNKFGA